MIRRQEGFTMVELLIAMVVFAMAIAAATAIFVPLLTQFKQQSKMTETQIEGVVGLEILRRDIEQAGYGLLWNMPAGVSYQEASVAPANSYNDSTMNPPRAFRSGDNAVVNPVIGASDYLVIKSTIVSPEEAGPKWTYIVGKGDGTGNLRTWGTGTAGDDFRGTDRVIALIPSRGQSETSQRILVNKGSAFSVQYSSVAANLAPSLENDKYLVYGVSSSSDLRMPFNRADYYIKVGGTLPPRCAPNTGQLVKAVLCHGGEPGCPGAGGVLQPETPLMDCVADFEVIYGLDVNGDGNITFSSDISGLTAMQVRDQVKEARVYILSHEGQKDVNYNAAVLYPAGTVTVGEFGIGRSFSLGVITDWQRYRWKVTSMVVRAKNLL